MAENNQISRTFEDLQVWQEAIALAKKIYQITRESEELSRDRSLVDQLRRASVSVSANISEGFIIVDGNIAISTSNSELYVQLSLHTAPQ